MEQAGHKCLGYVEIDKFARKSYEAIHNVKGEWTANDITTVTNDDLRLLRGKVDVICGGFPCQAFSTAGKQQGFEDTRGTLFFDIARFAKIIQPKMLFLENVKGLINHKSEIPFNAFLEIISEEVRGDTLWEEKYSPISNWTILADNLTHYLSEKLQIDSDLKKLKLDTSLRKNWGLVYEKTESTVDRGLKRRLIFLATQILLTMKKYKGCQEEATPLSEFNGKEWDSNQNLSYFIENMKTMDTSMLEKMVNMSADAGLSQNRKSEGNYDPMKLFTTLMEEKLMIDQKISMYAQEMSILLFIIKQWKSSTNLWKKVLSNLMNYKGGMYYVGTFSIILKTLETIGYDTEWSVLNSKDFGVPQNRERVFIIGHLRGSGGREVFPIGGTYKDTSIEVEGLIHGIDKMVYRVYSQDSISPCLDTMQGGLRQPKIRVNESNECKLVGMLDVKGYNDFSRRVYDPSGVARTLMASGGSLNDKAGQYVVGEKPYRIRRLTPKECWRLQGFPDSAFHKAQEVNSDSQLYKQSGNSVSVPVIYEIAKKLV